MTWTDLQKQIVELIQENERLKKENAELREQRDDFAAWYEAEKAKVKWAKKDIEDLMETIRRLKSEKQVMAG